ncbi:group II intron reverse transcriptase/maturase [Amycolatopsis panacis]|uniref:Group II intron reverse transcriptase/maturase n=1 Tax=Amycolatopsis panacis TaxID=2340917 RepID=A0A419IAY1_9PSEU|nr:group II intron reverse transcriptase/maturase [Amycolatopsis panacis]RJQ91107.1 group II intron reverse transcriptase/maturase [Amycolatopsis panacis]
MNTDDPDSVLYRAERRVLEIQTKLHRWAREDAHRRFDDLFNLVADPAFLLVAWDRVRGNKGAKTAGVDGRTAASIVARIGVANYLDGLRSVVKDRSFRPLPVRERMIPKAGGKLRRLGIATITDRVVQASLKLVLEPIFEADFLPCSYGFRPGRRAHDAVAEIRYLTSKPRCYEWIVEGDIKACFDEISHPALMERVRARIGDKRVLDLVKAFLKSGILGEDRLLRPTTAGTPQGSILSPLLSNVALSVLDEHIARSPGGPATGKTEKAKRLRHGLPNFKLVRYADDWCLVIKGSSADAEALREEIAEVLSAMGLRLSQEKTLITHIDDGLDFLGWRIQRRRKKGTREQYVYSYPAKKSLKAVVAKVKTVCREVEVNQPIDVLLRRLNPVLRGWCAYFRPGVSSVTFAYLSHYVWQTVWRWIRRKHRRTRWKELRHRYGGDGWWPTGQDREMFNPEKVSTTRYRYRGSVIPSPWPEAA